MVLLITSLTAFNQDVQILDTDIKPIECVTEAQYQAYMKPLLENSIKKLRAEGKLDFGTSAKMGGEVKLAWPLRMTDEYKNTEGVNSYFVVTNYADLNHDENYRLDWVCHTAYYDDYYFGGARNYDQHNGADIIPYPFPWQMMDDESVDIVAAADGEVIHVFDENIVDRNCDTPHVFAYEPFNGGYYGNFIALLHADNSVTIYGHMKNGTVANLEEGDNVVTGQYLGKMGSSGNSSAPHIHFEVRLSEGTSYIEPWYDSEGCNDDITESRWIDQIPYSEPEVLRVATHNALPVFKTCAEYEAGENEDVNFSNHFLTSETMIITVAMRDFYNGDIIDVDVINSSGIILESMDWVATTNYYREIFAFTVDLSGYTTGTYKVRVTHEGKYYYHYFTVNCPGALTLSGVQSGTKGYISGSTINSTSTISGVSTNNILYQAESYVKLNTGFQASPGCTFRAEIDDCTIGGLKVAQESTDSLLEQENAMNVFPNPNDGRFNITFANQFSEAGILNVYDINSKLLYSENFSSDSYAPVQLDFSFLPKGIYFVHLQMGEKYYSKPVIIQ